MRNIFLKDIIKNNAIGEGDWIGSEMTITAGPIKQLQVGSGVGPQYIGVEQSMLPYIVGNKEHLTAETPFIKETYYEDKFEENEGCKIIKEVLLISRQADNQLYACIVPEVDGLLIRASDVCWIAAGENYDLEYLMNVITSKEFWEKLQALKNGASKFRISCQDLSAIPFPEPPMLEHPMAVGL